MDQHLNVAVAMEETLLHGDEFPPGLGLLPRVQQIHFHLKIILQHHSVMTAMTIDCEDSFAPQCSPTVVMRVGFNMIIALLSTIKSKWNASKCMEVARTTCYSHMAQVAHTISSSWLLGLSSCTHTLRQATVRGPLTS